MRLGWQRLCSGRARDPDHLQPDGAWDPIYRIREEDVDPGTIVRGVMGWGRGVLSRAVAFWICITPRLKPLC